MAGLNETPKGDRVHIAFFGLRNAGKSTLVNRLTGQDVAIVSDVAGTTTDPVSKAMEILPLGPCLVTDTAGLDDEGPLGEMRVKKSLDVLATTDIAVWVETVESRSDPLSTVYARFLEACRARDIAVLHYRRGDDVDAFRRELAAVRLADAPRPLVRDLAWSCACALSTNPRQRGVSSSRSSRSCANSSTPVLPRSCASRRSSRASSRR